MIRDSFLPGKIVYKKPFRGNGFCNDSAFVQFRSSTQEPSWWLPDILCSRKSFWAATRWICRSRICLSQPLWQFHALICWVKIPLFQRQTIRFEFIVSKIRTTYCLQHEWVPGLCTGKGWELLLCALAYSSELPGNTSKANTCFRRHLDCIQHSYRNIILTAVTCSLPFSVQHTSDEPRFAPDYTSNLWEFYLKNVCAFGRNSGACTWQKSWENASDLTFVSSLCSYITKIGQAFECNSDLKLFAAVGLYIKQQDVILMHFYWTLMVVHLTGRMQFECKPERP